MSNPWFHALLDPALTALRDHMVLRKGERLVLVWDETVSTELYHALRAAGSFLGAEVTTVIYEPVAYRPINEYGLFAGRSLKEEIRLPRSVSASLKSTDTFVLLCSDTELLFSPDLPEILGTGARGLFIPYLDAFNANRMLFRNTEEVQDQANLINAVASLIEGDRMIHVSSEEGTDLRLKLGDYDFLRRTGIVSPGQMLFLPAGNVARVPNEGTANGTLVIDRTVCANDYKELKEQIILTVVDGMVTEVSGDTEAKLLRNFLESLDDERAFHLTEMAIGTNPRCKFSGIGAPSEDTHVWGTVSFALGCDVHIGGVTRGPAHVDMTMRFPTLTSDGATIVEDGRLVVSA